MDVGDGVMQSLLGLGSQGAKGALAGQAALVLLVVLVCWRIFGGYSQGRGRVIALSGALVTYWFLLAWGRHSTAGIEVSPRYLFLSLLLVLLLLVEVAVGVAAWLRHEQMRGRRAARPAAVVLGLAVTIIGGLAVLHNARTELEFGGILRANARAMRGQVYGLALLNAETRAKASAYLEPLGPQIGRPASAFLETLERFGGIEPSEADVTALPADGRARTDQALLLASVSPQPAAGGDLGVRAPETSAVAGQGRLRESGPCALLGSEQQAPVLVDVKVPENGIAVTNTSQGPLTVQGRRYAADWNGPAKVDVAPQTSLVVRLPPDRGAEPWQIRVAGSAGRFCTLR